MYLSNSELKQLDLLKKKTPQERFMMMAQLIQSQIEAMKAGIKYRNPNLSDEELQKKFRDEMLKMYSIKIDTSKIK